MSFITGLRASTSTSRHYVPLSQFHRAPVVFRATRQYASVQEMDQQMAEQRRKLDIQDRRMARARARGQNVDDPEWIAKMLQFPLFEPHNLRRDRPGWYSLTTNRKNFFKSRYEYIIWLYSHTVGTSRAISDGSKYGIIELSTRDDQKLMSRWNRIKRWFNGDYTAKIIPSLLHAQDVYNKVHIAQAARDLSTIEKISTGSVQKTAERVANSGLDMEWQLEEDPQLPQLSWLRIVPVPPYGHVGQICLQFDTKQRLTIASKPRNGPASRSVKSQHVKEAVVFDIYAIKDAKPFWKMKERVDMHTPKFALEEGEKEEWDTRQRDFEKTIEKLNQGAGVSSK